MSRICCFWMSRYPELTRMAWNFFFKTMDYLKKHYDLAIILISHDLDYVARYADHVVLLDKTVLRQGTVKEVYESSEFERIFSAGKEETWIKEDETND